MPIPFLIDIDLNQNELQNAVLQNLGVDPGAPVEGQVWFRTDQNSPKVYDGTAVATIWTSTNDGAASGLDADLLDAQEGTYYLARANHTGTQLHTTISDFDTGVQENRLDQLAAPTASVDLNSQKIINLLDPTNPQDAATKAYADSIVSGLDVKDSVRVASTANIDLGTGGLLTIDGVALSAGDRVLVKNQTTASENGIYVAAAGAWTRATDADTNAEVTAGMFTFVAEGTTHADSGWVLTTNDPITVGTTALAFTQFSGAGTINAGDGLTKTGDTLNVGGTADRISVSADAVDIAATYVGQASITTLGTITTGVWEATDIAVAHGGTGASTAAGAKTNLGFIGRFASAVGDGVATQIDVTHSFGTRDVTVEVYEAAAPYRKAHPQIEHLDTNNVRLIFGAAPASGEYRVVVTG